MGNIDRLRARTLVVTTIPLLRAAFHLRRIVGHQGQTLEAATSSDRTRGNEVVQGQRVERSKGAAWTLDGLVNDFSRRVGRIGIVAGGTGILDVELRLELLEALCPRIIDVLSVGDEGRRRRSTRSGHFEWRTG